MKILYLIIIFLSVGNSAFADLWMLPSGKKNIKFKFENNVDRKINYEDEHDNNFFHSISFDCLLKIGVNENYNLQLSLSTADLLKYNFYKYNRNDELWDHYYDSYDIFFPSSYNNSSIALNYKIFQSDDYSFSSLFKLRHYKFDGLELEGKLLLGKKVKISKKHLYADFTVGYSRSIRHDKSSFEIGASLGVMNIRGNISLLEWMYKKTHNNSDIGKYLSISNEAVKNQLQYSMIQQITPSIKLQEAIYVNLNNRMHYSNIGQFIAISIDF